MPLMLLEVGLCLDPGLMKAPYELLIRFFEDNAGGRMQPGAVDGDTDRSGLIQQESVSPPQ